MTEYTITTKCGAEALAVKFDNGEGFAVGLTPCCGASAKGLDSERGSFVGCRGCYAEIHPSYGAINYPSVEAATRDANCPIPQECAQHALWELAQASGLDL